MSVEVRSKGVTVMPVTKGSKKPEKVEKRSVVRDTVAGDGGDAPEYCVECGGVVKASQRGLECDSCGFWHHATCVGVGEEIYNFLSSHQDEKSILWHCKKCVVTGKRMAAVIAAMQEHQQLLEDRIGVLTETLGKKMEELLEDKIGTLTETLGKRVEELATVVNTVLGSRDQSAEKEKEDDTQKRVEEKVDKLMEKIEKQKTEEGPRQIKGCIQQCVKATLKEDREEEEEQQRRKTNVIIHGLEESNGEEPEDRKAEDAEKVAALVSGLGLGDVGVAQIIRLGKKDGNEDGRPRSVKVVLGSEDQRDKLLMAAKNLKGKKDEGWDRVYIQQDLTLKQREVRKGLLATMKERKLNGEQNLTLWNWKIVQRKPKQN